MLLKFWPLYLVLVVLAHWLCNGSYFYVYVNVYFFLPYFSFETIAFDIGFLNDFHPNACSLKLGLTILWLANLPTLRQYDQLISYMTLEVGGPLLIIPTIFYFLNHKPVFFIIIVICQLCSISIFNFFCTTMSKLVFLIRLNYFALFWFWLYFVMDLQSIGCMELRKRETGKFIMR